MRFRTLHGLLASSFLLTIGSGCQEPAEIIPVAPPGYDMVRVPPPSAAQAIGEQASPSPSTASANATAGADAKPSQPGLPPTPIGKPVKTPSGLTYETLKEGTGKTAQAGQTVSIHYTGTLADGTVFDSSKKTGKPFVTPIGFGFGPLIQGWNEGVPGMKVGESRKLLIPANLAYGGQGRDGIPPNSDLTFEVELMDVN